MLIRRCHSKRFHFPCISLITGKILFFPLCCCLSVSLSEPGRGSPPAVCPQQQSSVTAATLQEKLFIAAFHWRRRWSGSSTRLWVFTPGAFSIPLGTPHLDMEKRTNCVAFILYVPIGLTVCSNYRQQPRKLSNMLQDFTFFASHSNFMHPV